MAHFFSPFFEYLASNFKHNSICGSVAESVECALLVRRVGGSNPDESHAGFKNSSVGMKRPVGILMPRVLTTFLSNK